MYPIGLVGLWDVSLNNVSVHQHACWCEKHLGASYKEDDMTESQSKALRTIAGVQGAPNQNKNWLEGIKAFETGVSRDRCPYPAAPERIQWYEGYDFAAIIMDDK